MKQSEIQPCILCGKGVMHTGLPLFYRVTIERMGVDVKAVKRQHGLEMVLGSPALAYHMGPGEDIAKPLHAPAKVMICETCAMESMPVAAIAERANDANAVRAEPKQGNGS